MKPHGIIVPLVTPLTDTARIDTSSLKALLDFVITGGVDGVFVAGTSGEFARLEEHERHKLFSETVDHVAGRVPVFAGVSDTNITAVERHMQAAGSAGVDAVVVSLPYYFPINSAEEAYRWFAELVPKAGKPCLIYNIPDNTGAGIPAAVLASINGLVCGIKDSGSEEAGIYDYIKALGGQQRRTSYLCGNEALLMKGISAGADGFVPSMANVFPRLWQAIWRNRADEAKLQRLADQVKEINVLNSRYASSLGSVMWKKQALSLLGIMPATMSPPSINEASGDATLLRTIMEQVDQLLSQGLYLNGGI